MQYRREIDGLRAVAVIPVIFFHAGFTIFSGGYVGVDIFFVISGYLITSIIINELEQGNFSILRFYERRARRILPALFLVMFTCVPIAYFALLPNHFVDFAESLISVPLFISNVLFWSERGYFGVTSELKPLVHTWSLAVEEQFYTFFPALLILSWNIAKRSIGRLLIIISLVSLLISWYLTKLHFETAFYLPFARAWELMLGAIAAYYFSPLTKFAKKSPIDLGVGRIVWSIYHQFSSNSEISESGTEWGAIFFASRTSLCTSQISVSEPTTRE